jgi:hypothetical protein
MFALEPFADSGRASSNVSDVPILLQKSLTSAVRPADLASEGGIEPLVAAVPVWEWRPLTLVLS